MLNTLYAIARPSVRLSVTRVDQSKTVEGRIMQLTPYGSPISSFCGVSFSQKFLRVPPERVYQTREGWENKPFSSFKRQYLESKTVGDTSKVTINAYNRKLHKRFQLTPRLMTLDDLELLSVRIFRDFAGFGGNNG